MRPPMRFQLPPDNPTDAGPLYRSRLYERFVEILPVCTYACVLWCVSVYFLLNQESSTHVNVKKLMHFLGATSHQDLANGRWWGLVGSAFIHKEFFHLAFNMYWLVRLGSLMERGLGSLKTFAFIVVAAYVSSALQLTIGGGPGIGFSGVVYAMIGFVWGAWPRYTGFLERVNGQTVRFFLIWQGLCFLLSWGGILAIAHTAHISGMIFGYLIGQWACKGIKGGWYWLAACLAMILIATGLIII
ncbi:MAG: rhomboid family intramembrane serine protease [Verrucomicrobiae bacterium]|nr:rhomboid family intramembrane serine protease [Verrucomicrobiae bacterium]NNJ42110.1 rhomboid family intramembrane serine protease [Akkermansiaceae bacterium]